MTTTERGWHTRFGFEWGPMTVERLCHVEGCGYSLEIRTGHKRLQVYVSEAGRKIEPCEVREVSARCHDD